MAAKTAAERMRAYREREAAKAGRVLHDQPGRPPSAKHGSDSCYSSGCRLEACKKAHAAAARAYRRGLKK